MGIEIFPKSVKKESIIPKICMSNPKKKSIQNWKCLKIKLVKNKKPFLLHPPIPLILKVLQKIQKEGKITILITLVWKGQIWLNLLKNLISQ
jgi:hypothetical protein